MMITIAMMMRLLSGTIAIKTQGSKIKNKRRVSPVPGIHQDEGISACQKKKKRDRKIVGINRTFLCLVTGYKNIFDIRRGEIRAKDQQIAAMQRL